MAYEKLGGFWRGERSEADDMTEVSFQNELRVSDGMAGLDYADYRGLNTD